MRIYIFSTIVFGIAIITLFGCSKEVAQDTLVIGIQQTIPTLDPAMHRDRTVESVLRNMFDGLVTRDFNMRVVPQLAESWEIVDDFTWRFHLRKGVKFHNGEDFTAEDVKFTIQRIIDEGAIDGQSSPRKGLLGPVKGVEIEDDYTVLIKTENPWPILPAMLTFQEIVPKDYIEEKGDGYFAEHPIGAGPFKFVEWVKGERIVMQRFDDYYGGSPDIPPVAPAKIKTLIFKPIPETASRIAALKSGECHIIQSLPPHLVDEVQSDERTAVLTCEGTRSYFVGMNCKEKPFSDVRVRRAMNYAVDMESIVKTILEGMAILLPGPLVPAAFGYNEELKLYGYDANIAKELLKEAGYENGFEVELDTDKDMREIAEAVSSQLAKVGVKAKVRMWEWGVLRPQLEAQKRSLFMASWGNASLDPVGILIPTLKTEGRGNFTGYSNPKVDELLDKASTGMNLQERKDYFQEAQKLIHSDAPWIFGYSPKEIYGVRKSVVNWRPTPDGRMNMHDVYLGTSLP